MVKQYYEHYSETGPINSENTPVRRYALLVLTLQMMKLSPQAIL